MGVAKFAGDLFFAKPLRSIESEIVSLTEYYNSLCQTYETLKRNVLSEKDLRTVLNLKRDDFKNGEDIVINGNIYKPKDYLDNQTEHDKELNVKIGKYNGLLDKIIEEKRKIRQFMDVLSDIETYLSYYGLDDKEPVFKFGFDQKENLICMICNLTHLDITDIRSFSVYIFYGDYHKYQSLEGHCTLLHSKMVGRVVCMNDFRSSEKGLGRGSFALECMESMVIPEINKMIKRYNADHEANHVAVNAIGGYSDESKPYFEERNRLFQRNGYMVEDSGYIHKNITV